MTIHNKPQVSVVIPCYNSETTIIEAIESVINQTFNNYELIIINDGSTDKSKQIIDAYTSNHDRIVSIHIPNQGVSNARNIGIKKAKGEFVAFLDSDDIWHPNKLESQIDFMKNNNSVGVCFSKVEFFTSKGIRTNQYSTVPIKGLNSMGLLTENLTCTTSNLLCRKEIFSEIGTFNKAMSFAEDQEWLLRITLLSSWEIQGIQQIHVNYRTNPGSLSSNLNSMEQGWESLVEQVIKYSPKFISTNYTRSKSIYLRYLARRSLRQNDHPAIGISYMKRSWKYDKFLYFRQPKRTFGTLFSLYILQLIYTGRKLLLAKI